MEGIFATDNLKKWKRLVEALVEARRDSTDIATRVEYVTLCLPGQPILPEMVRRLWDLGLLGAGVVLAFTRH